MFENDSITVHALMGGTNVYDMENAEFSVEISCKKDRAGRAHEQGDIRWLLQPEDVHDHCHKGVKEDLPRSPDASDEARISPRFGGSFRICSTRMVRQPKLHQK